MVLGSLPQTRHKASDAPPPHPPAAAEAEEPFLSTTVEGRFAEAMDRLRVSRAAEARLRAEVLELNEELQRRTHFFEKQMSALRQEREGARGVSGALPPQPSANAAVPTELHPAVTAGVAGADFTSVWLTERRYQDVMDRFRSLLFSSHQSPDTANLASFWDGMGGAEVWSARHSMATLDLLLSREERSVFVMRKDYDRAAEHQFLEYVLSRLPCLTKLSLNGMAYTVADDFNLASQPHAFKKLSTLDVSQCSTLTAEQLRRLVEVMPALTQLNVSGCEALTWAEVVAIAQTGRRGPLALTPADEGAFAKSQDEQFVSRVAEKYVKGHQMIARLLDFWHAYHGPSGFIHGMTPARLTAVLQHSAIKSTLISGVASKDVPTNALVPADELTAFVSQVCSRLPLLEKLQIRSCPRGWPIDFHTLSEVAASANGLLTAPFPGLKHLSVLHTSWRVEDLTTTLERLPTLDNQTGVATGTDGKVALEVSLDNGPAGVDVVAVREACKQKVYIWAN